MLIKDCSCPGKLEEKSIALECAILTFCCPQCGGGLASDSDYLYGIIQQLEILKADLYQQLGDIKPPGKAIFMTCEDCGGEGCGYCHNSGTQLWRACPKCRDTGFDFINGVNERDGMICRIGCGFKWGADDPRWLAQRLPSKA
jgi:hypothetical protein